MAIHITDERDYTPPPPVADPLAPYRITAADMAHPAYQRFVRAFIEGREPRLTTQAFAVFVAVGRAGEVRAA